MSTSQSDSKVALSPPSQNTTATAPPTPPPRGSVMLSENIFDDIDFAAAGEEGHELLKRREPTMQRRGKKLVAPMSQDTQRRYTVVFDLDETVVYARDGPLYARAYLKDLLTAVKGNFEVIVWTAGDREYAKNVLAEINADHAIEHLIYRHSKWFNEEDYTKDLTQLGRDLNYTIIIENTPDCVRANPGNGIIVEDFEVVPAGGGESGGTTTTTTTTTTGTEQAPTTPPKPRRATTDRTLLLLREVLEKLAESGEPVPVFLSRCELLSRQTVTGCDGHDIPIYYLGPRRRRKDAGSPRKTVRVNRDRVGGEEEGEGEPGATDGITPVPPRDRTPTPTPPPPPPSVDCIPTVVSGAGNTANDTTPSTPTTPTLTSRKTKRVTAGADDSGAAAAKSTRKEVNGK